MIEHLCPIPLAIEVLRALVLGLDLRKTIGGWRFVGPWQDPEKSGVASAVMLELLENGLVEHGGGCAKITACGHDALRHSTEAAFRAALKCPLFVGSSD